MTVFRPAQAHLAALDRSAAYYRVLLLLSVVLDEQRYSRITAQQIADALDLGRSTVERVLGQLAADRVLINTGSGSGVVRRLSRRLGWRQGAELYNLAEMEQEDLPLIDGRGRGGPGSSVAVGETLQRVERIAQLGGQRTASPLASDPGDRAVAGRGGPVAGQGRV